MLHTKRLVIALGFLIVTGCLTYTPIPIEYDYKILSTSLDGFRIQMLPRMAKRIANEKGYKIDSGNLVTFDDIVEGGVGLAAIYLTRSGEDDTLKDTMFDQIRVSLHFEYGKIYEIRLSHTFFGNHQQQAEEMLESYLEEYPRLVLEKENGLFRAYTYKPNQSAYISATIKTEKYSKVTFGICDYNYTNHKESQKIY